jgi:hypothetical protein
MQRQSKTIQQRRIAAKQRWMRTRKRKKKKQRQRGSARIYSIFFGQLCSIAKSGDNRQEDLAIFDYKLNYESKVLKNFLLCFWLPILNNVLKYREFFLKFGLIMTIENFKKHLILVFSFTFLFVFVK